MKLPEVFIDRMKNELLSSGITEDGFFESFDSEGLKGIRINKSKAGPDDYGKILSSVDPDGSHTKVSWCDSGFYTKAESSGNSPYYHAGVIYPQEPSAMLPAQVLGAKPGDVVIDLCAAPGGKACRIAEDLKGEGLLIANEISENRAKALLRNIERMGISNVVVLNEDPINMRNVLEGVADKIIVDAPCSGEGMFRRDPSAVKSWEKYGPSECVILQASILESADILLKEGGELVYSTCTYGQSEDEDQILDFMSKHPEYEVIPHPKIEGVTHASDHSKLPGSMRIWPHISDGDGHFCVHLKKNGTAQNEARLNEFTTKPGKLVREKDAILRFMSGILNDESYKSFCHKVNDSLLIKGTHASIPSVDERSIKGLKTVKNGLYIGELKPSGKELNLMPSHSLALTLKKDMLKSGACIDYSFDDPSVRRYLKGETLTADPGAKGPVVIMVEGFPLGFGKRSADGMIKNLYPKAWRLL